MVVANCRENGAKSAVRVAAAGAQQQQKGNTLLPTSAPASASSGSSSGVSGTGSDSTAQAMWTAISNPLLLISHVLSKSMELTPDGQSAAAASSPLPHQEAASSSTEEAGGLCREFVAIEQHPEPHSRLKWIDADR